MKALLRRWFPIGPYTPKHWLDTDKRGDWLVPVCLGVVVLVLFAITCIPAKV